MLQPNSPTTDLLAMRLREATRGAHHDIDHHPLVAPLVRPDLTLPQYLRVLRTMWWVHVPLQALFARQITALGADFELANRVAWLQADLTHFGLPDALPVEPWVPPFPGSVAELVGMLYVIEGSTLGGQIISRQLKLRIGVESGRGATFFNGWGAETDTHWRKFWAFASSVCPVGQTALAVPAAIRMFEQLRSAFDMALLWAEPQCN